MADVAQVKAHAQTDIQNVSSLSELEQIEIKYLGRNGKVNELAQEIKNIPEDKRKEFGKNLNEIKNFVTTEIQTKKQELLQLEEQTASVDVTFPGKTYPKGSLHIVTYAIEEISKIFERIGFIRMSYPEVEWEYFSFESLNMPQGHPARDDFETFFIDHPSHPELGRMLLTPHTSSGQNREMKRLGKPPIRMINIARTYRPNWDVSHVPMFHQFEGLVVDEGINITHLKGTIDYFAKEFFGENRQTRLRPFHFQFTEPSFEVDITCDICGGTGYIKCHSGERSDSRIQDRSWTSQDDDMMKCKLCKSGWLELGGSGMVHPNVLKAGGIDSAKYTGWAFGIGVERVIMMKEGLKLDDIRTLYANDIRFLGQF